MCCQAPGALQQALATRCVARGGGAAVIRYKAELLQQEAGWRFTRRARASGRGLRQLGGKGRSHRVAGRQIPADVLVLRRPGTSPAVVGIEQRTGACGRSRSPGKGASRGAGAGVVRKPPTPGPRHSRSTRCSRWRSWRLVRTEIVKMKIYRAEEICVAMRYRHRRLTPASPSTGEGRAPGQT